MSAMDSTINPVRPCRITSGTDPRRRGSVPEVIRHGRTGFIVESMADMVRAVRRLDRVDRAECRREVEARFSVERMADGYEVLYRRLGARARTA